MTGAARRNTYRRVKMRATGVLATTVAAAIVFSGLATAVSAGPASAAPGVSAIERVVAEGPHLHAVYVHSASMDKTIKVQVLTPRADTGPRPSLYLLGGLNEQDPNNSVWTLKTDLAGFYADKNVNVVMPIAGDGSFYTDWQRDDPTLGRHKWETFLTRELPPLIDTQFSGNGVRGVAGLSMGAGAALVLAARNPGFYDAVAPTTCGAARTTRIGLHTMCSPRRETSGAPPSTSPPGRAAPESTMPPVIPATRTPQTDRSSVA